MKADISKIRFGVICPDKALSAWQEIALRKLISQTDIELKLVIHESNRANAKHPSSDLEGTSQKTAFLWNLYNRLRVKKKSKALQKAETHKLFEGVPAMRCNFYVLTDGSAELKTKDITVIENTQLDFIIDFATLKIHGNVLNAARHGVWSFRFGNLENYSVSIPSFWEIYLEEVLTSAYLIRLTDNLHETIVLKEGHLKTEIFYPKNIDKIHFEATDWPLKICQDIRNNRTKNLTIKRSVKLNENRRSPSNLVLFIFFFIQLKLLFKKINRKLFYTDYWNIGVALSPIQDFLDPKKIPSIQWFPDLPRSRFMADPFGISIKGELFIVYEDFRFDQGVGKIASFLFDNETFLENKIVIDEKFHMSYPFLLEHESEIYCIPETYQANQVRLYRALEFPMRWKFEKVLIENYAAIDNTPFKYGDTWFLFSTDKHAGPHHNLNIHYSKSIFGPWKEHPKNPVKTDIRSARPAGTLFTFKRELFRPSMDYSEKIEGRIIINRIMTLTIDDFREEVYNIVDPFADTIFSDKTHTLSQMGDYTLIDGAKELFIFSNLSALKYKIKRIYTMLKK